MNHRNRQQIIIRSVLIISVSLIVCVGLAFAGIYFLDSFDYPRAVLIAVVIGLAIGIILSMILNRSPQQTRSSGNSLYDPRFDVYTRDYMITRLDEEIARVKIQRESLAVALVELVYGENQHMKDPEIATKFLRKAIQQIQSRLANTYTVGYDEGNTFIVIMPETTEQEAILLAQDMYASITEKPIVLNDNTSTDFKIIVGIVENNNGIQDTESALQLARRALLSAWGARYDSIGFVSGFRTASINTVQVEIVAFGAIGEFAVEAIPRETIIQQVDETIPVRADDFFEFNIGADEDTVSISPPAFNSDSPPKAPEESDVTQPISPFILDSLSDDYLSDVEDHNLEDIESTQNKFSTPEIPELATEIKTDRLSPKDNAASEPDDFSRIAGIGPKYAEILNAAGITRYAQIAVMSEDEIVELIKLHGGRKSSSMATWAEQANLAAANDWDALEKLKAEFRFETDRLTIKDNGAKPPSDDDSD